MALSVSITPLAMVSGPPVMPFTLRQGRGLPAGEARFHELMAASSMPTTLQTVTGRSADAHVVTARNIIDQIEAAPTGLPKITVAAHDPNEAVDPMLVFAGVEKGVEKREWSDEFATSHDPALDSLTNRIATTVVDMRGDHHDRTHDHVVDMAAKHIRDAFWTLAGVDVAPLGSHDQDVKPISWATGLMGDLPLDNVDSTIQTEVHTYEDLRKVEKVEREIRLLHALKQIAKHHREVQEAKEDKEKLDKIHQLAKRIWHLHELTAETEQLEEPKEPKEAKEQDVAHQEEKPESMPQTFAQWVEQALKLEMMKQDSGDETTKEETTLPKVTVVKPEPTLPVVTIVQAEDQAASKTVDPAPSLARRQHNDGNTLVTEKHPGAKCIYFPEDPTDCNF